MDTTHTNPFLKTGEKIFINHNQIEALLENIPKIIYMKDTKGNFITGTKQAKEFIKSGIDGLCNVQLDFSKMVATNNAEDSFVVKNSKSINNEREILDVNGIPHCYSIYKAPINNPTNDVVGIVVMINNIDNSKLIEAQRNTFVASLGHDLKNPTLAQIRALELLLRSHFGALTEEQREIIQMVLESCNYMNAMLGSLLATYRTERGVVRLNYEEFSFSDFVMECIGEMTYVARNKEIGISIEKRCLKDTVFADKVQIKRVIMNLLSNGIKYAYKNSILNVSIYNEKDLTCFQFENESPYIPPEKQEAIFAQYVSYAEAHKELGIGLGLYASQKIIEAHDGEIFVKSFKDNKNIFGFKIPNSVKDKDKPRCVTF